MRHSLLMNAVRHAHPTCCKLRRNFTALFVYGAVDLRDHAAAACCGWCHPAVLCWWRTRPVHSAGRCLHRSLPCAPSTSVTFSKLPLGAFHPIVLSHIGCTPFHCAQQVGLLAAPLAGCMEQSECAMCRCLNRSELVDALHGQQGCLNVPSTIPGAPICT